MVGQIKDVKERNKTVAQNKAAKDSQEEETVLVGNAKFTKKKHQEKAPLTTAQKLRMLRATKNKQKQLEKSKDGSTESLEDTEYGSVNMEEDQKDQKLVHASMRTAAMKLY